MRPKRHPAAAMPSPRSAALRQDVRAAAVPVKAEPFLPVSTDLQGGDLAARELESITKVDWTTREVPSQVRGDNRAVSNLLRRSDRRMVAVLAPGILRPDANGAAAADIPPLIAHDGVVGEAGGDAVGIIGIGRGEIIGDGLWHLHGTIPPCASSVCTRQGSTGLH